MLGDYLKDAASRPWKAAEHDCTAFPARWANVPMPLYSSDEQAQEMIDRAGSLLDLVAVPLDARFPRVTAPEEGDIGVILAVGRDFAVTQIGAIWTGKRWAFAVAPGGIACASATSLAVWRV